MEDQKVSKDLALSLWRTLKMAVIGQCNSIGRSSPVQLKCEEDGANRIVITNPKSMKTASLEFNPDIPCVFYKSLMQDGRIMTRLSPDRKAIQWIRNGTPQTAEDLAFNTVREVL